MWGGNHLFLAGICLLLCGCHTQYLEKKWIGNLEVREFTKGPDLYLQVSGSSNHSALGIKAIETEQDGNKLIIFIYLKLGGDGNFQKMLLIPKSVDQVLIKDEPIWHRKLSIP